jgi:hypothetical protein
MLLIFQKIAVQGIKEALMIIDAGLWHKADHWAEFTNV